MKEIIIKNLKEKEKRDKRKKERDYKGKERNKINKSYK